MDDVIEATVFMVDPEQNFKTGWHIARPYWGEAPHPAATAIGVTWLYGFEIKVVAKLSEVV